MEGQKNAEPTTFAEALDEADSLTDAIDPEENPYKSKYAARELLKIWRKKLDDGEVDEPFAGARVAFRMGRIGLDTEEPHEAAIELEKAAAVFFPGLEAAVLAQVGGEDAKPRPVAELQTPSVNLAPAVLEGVKAGEHGDVAEEALEVLNLLGILWSGREEPSRSLLYLLAARDLYATLDPLMSNESKRLNDEAANMPPVEGRGRVRHGVFRRELDSLYTHTLFYLAQVYGLLEMPDQSASYCQQTLKRQLEVEVNLDTLGWAKNCLSLVDYFTKLKHDYQAACHALCACSAILDDRTPAQADPEAVALVRGEIARRWVWLYLALLQDAADHQELKEAEHLARLTQGTNTMSVEAAEGKGLASSETPQDESNTATASATASVTASVTATATASVTASAAADALPPPPVDGAHPPAVDKPPSSQCERFDVLNFHEPMLPPPEAVNSYETAREVFLKALKSVEEAKSFFLFDGFVTDHVHLLRDTSRLYRHLAIFEQDEKRKQAMFQRRAAPLQAVLDQISPRAYEGLHKQLAFELGEVYMEMMDLKASRMEAKLNEDPSYRVKRSEADKCHEYNLLACRAFEHFTNMYQVEDDKDATKKVWRFEKEELRPILRAGFHLARLYSRAHPLAPPKEQIAAAHKSLKQYEWVRDFAENNIRKHCDNDRSIFAQELAMCEEMVQMLPEKINQMHFMGKKFVK